ncbi:uncharacterized protein PEZ65_005960 [Lycodopsis pacificus]
MNTIPLDETENSKEAAAPNRMVGRMAASSEEVTEEADYVNAAVCTVDKEAASPVSDQRSPSFTRSLPLIAVCWLMLLLIMGLRLHFTSVISEHDAKLTAEIQNLREQNENLTTQNQQMKTEKNNYTTLLAANRNLTNLNDKLNLTELIQTRIELNISRAQWSIDAYCPKTNNVRQCHACLDGWKHTSPSCYVTRDGPHEEITWEEARENCRGRNADLVVVQTQQEKGVVNGYSYDPYAYWIGLRVEEGKWKWINGSDLTQTSWIGAPTEGHCAVSIQNRGWTSVMCEDKKRWICKQEALTV